MNKLACWIALVFSFAVLSPALAIAQQFPADDDLRLMLRYHVEDQGIPGMVMGVLEPDGSTRIVSYGTAGPDTKPLGPKTLFEIGSITKLFTATILADMVAKGEVEQGIRLVYAGLTARERTGTPLPPGERVDTDRTLAAATQHLAAEALAAARAWAAGCDLDAAIAMAEAVVS